MSLPRFTSDLEAARAMVMAVEASAQRLRLPHEAVFEAAQDAQRALTRLELLLRQEFPQGPGALTSCDLQGVSDV